MSEKAIFELGENGVITDPDALLRRVYVLSQLSDQNQSVLFSSDVLSMQYLGSIYGNEPTRLASELETGFTNKLRALFPEGVTVTVKEKDPGEKARYTLQISMTVIKDGARHTLQGALYRDNAEDFTKLQDAIV